MTYRDSGIPEIGQIPAHWNTRKLRYAYAAVRSGNWGGEPTGDANDVACLRIGDFDVQTLRLKDQPRALRSWPYKPGENRYVHVPSLLLERAGGSDNVPVGKVVLYEEDEQAIASNFIVELEPRAQEDPFYLLFQHFELYRSGRVRRAASHTHGIQNLNVQDYLDETVAWPPADEQRAIGARLNAAHQRSNRLVELRSRQRMLIHERCAAKTRALLLGAEHTARDPNVSAWRTSLPSKWQVRRLSTLVEVRPGAIFSASDFGNDGVPVVRLSDLAGDEIDLEQCIRIHPDLVSESAWAESGDVLVALSSKVGRASVVQERVAVNQRVAALRYKARADDGPDEYLNAFLLSKSFRQQVEQACATSTGIPNLGMDDLRNVIVPWPPVEQRKAVGAQLAALNKDTDRLSACIADAATLYQERFVARVHQDVHGRALG